MNFRVLCSMFVAVLLLAACESKEPPAGSVEKVKKSAGKTLDASKEFATAKKDEYAKKIEAQLGSITPKIDELKAKAAKASTDVRAKLDLQISDLDKKRTEIQKKLEDMKTSTSAAFTDMKDGIDKALKELDDSYNKAKARF